LPEPQLTPIVPFVTIIQPFFRPWRASLFLLGAALGARAAEPNPEATQDFRAAADLIRAGQVAEAVPLLEKVRAATPNVSAIEWNLGLAYAELDRPEDALGCWRKMSALEPTNWQVTSKMVQAFHALGRLEERDRAIEQVRAQHKVNTDPQLLRIPGFCREQFKVNGQKVMAVEYFEPKPPSAVYLAFLVVDAAGKEQFRYSLGSYDETTEVARSIGQVGARDRLYHLDYYRNEASSRVHRTYGFFKYQPGYATLREIVVKAMKGEAQPVSASALPTEKK
jgi:tetratricopeptide (TPR) repeat protein